MVPRDPALGSRPPAFGRTGVPQHGPGRPHVLPGAARPPGGIAPGPWTTAPPRYPGPIPSARKPVILPRPAPPRSSPALWLSVLFVVLVAVAAAAYLATTTTAGRAVADGVGTYVVDHWRLLLPVGIVGGLSWGVWAVRKLLSVLYRPTVNDFRTTTSVVVPSFRERWTCAILRRCLGTWLAQDPRS